MYNTKAMLFGQKIYEWISDFAPTYRGVLPAGVQPEDLYIRFNGVYDDFATQFIFQLFIYKHNTTSYSSVILLADKIGAAVGQNGLLIGDDNIKIKIDRGSPFYQDAQDEDETVRAGMVNLIVTIY